MRGAVYTNGSIYTVFASAMENVGAAVSKSPPATASAGR